MGPPTADQLATVDNSLQKMTASDDTIHKNGATLFSKLFQMEPSSLHYFGHFDGMGSDYMGYMTSNPKGKKHSENVFRGLKAILAVKGDGGQLQVKATQLAKDHKGRDINKATFELMFKVFPVYLKEIGMGDKATVDAWDALIHWFGTFF